MVNLSEGRDAPWLEALRARLDSAVDLHRDADHHRSVLTLIGSPAQVLDEVLEIARAASEHLDFAAHTGVHPRIGIIDVVPFVPLGTATLDAAGALRDEAARRLSAELDLPCFLYGPLEHRERTLPEIRKGAFTTLAPDFGPQQASHHLGAVAVGARRIMVAWNLWITGAPLGRAQELAAAVRGPQVRALGFTVEGAVQVSCNLLSPLEVTCADIADQVGNLLTAGEAISKSELVGLAPALMLERIEASRWVALDLNPERTIEAAASRLGLSLV